MNLKPPSRAASTLTLVAVMLVATTLLAQQLAPPTPAHEQIAKLVCQMIEREHLSHSRFDDKISGRLTDRFLKDLDPQKLYFYQSDIDDLDVSRTTLDEALRAGNMDFAFKAFKLYLTRLDERIAAADKVVDAKEVGYAKSSQELDERWRKRVKYDLLLFKLENTAEAESRDRLHKRYRNIKRTMHQLETEDIVEMYLTALATCFDPHSGYMSPRSQRDFEIQMRLNLDGIGAALRGDDGYTVVAQIVPGGAAALDGRLKVGDKIIGVGQEEGEVVDVVEMKLSNVVEKIRGRAGTKVRLQVQPAANATESKIYELTRRKIELKASEVKGEIIDASTRVPGATGRIGVIHIPSFYRDFNGAQNGVEEFKSTARDVRHVLRDFASKGGVDGLVIDLRTNGGGALSEAIEVSGIFIDQGPVVQVKDLPGNVKSLDDEEAGIEFKKPLVVLCNRLSASASEIFAGVIKDYDRGLIVGDTTTHGKGTVQSVMNVGKQMFQLFNPPDRGALKLTIQQFYRVNGDSTQNLGVQSDVALPSLLDHMDIGESSLDNALAFDRIPVAPHTDMKMINPDLVSALRERSQKRVAQVKEFQDLEKDILKYVERKKRKTISLNEEQLRQERLSEEQKLKNKAEEPEETTDGPIFPDDYYNKEVLNITLDYLAAFRGNNTARK
jgi:carboxyl-terminal processing protease